MFLIFIKYSSLMLIAIGISNIVHSTNNHHRIMPLLTSSLTSSPSVGSSSPAHSRSHPQVRPPLPCPPFPTL